jgi:hypothetical protein
MLIHTQNLPKNACSERPLHIFPFLAHLAIGPTGSYVKTMSADDGHLGWRSRSLDIILKVDHLRTIHAMFALNWLTGFRRNFF